jgi:DNA polymerase sliding clamp subunit (PCNA homolog)
MFFEEIELIKKEGEDVNIAFNSRYLMDGVRVIDSEEIELNFVSSLNPCIMRAKDDENYIYLVLPVRLAQDDF